MGYSHIWVLMVQAADQKWGGAWESILEKNRIPEPSRALLALWGTHGQKIIAQVAGL